VRPVKNTNRNTHRKKKCRESELGWDVTAATGPLRRSRQPDPRHGAVPPSPSRWCTSSAQFPFILHDAPLLSLDWFMLLLCREKGNPVAHQGRVGIGMRLRHGAARCCSNFVVACAMVLARDVCVNSLPQTANNIAQRTGGAQNGTPAFLHPF